MQKFLLEVVVFLVITVLGYLAIDHEASPQSADYLAAIVDKHQRVNETNSPKVLFVGGSNLAFGIDSKMISDTLGIPVVNLSLHAGLGVDFILREAEDVMESHDIIILSIEYFLGSKGNYALQENASNAFNRAYSYYDIDFRRLITSKLSNTQQNLKQAKRVPSIHTVYARKSFNEYGDVVAHLEKQASLKQLNDKSKLKYSYWEGITLINSFAAQAKKKQVAVFFLYPNYLQSQYIQNQEAILQLKADIDKDLQVTSLNTPQDFVYTDSLFYDTIYHLNKQGRNLRTQKLLSLLRQSQAFQESLEVAKGESKL